ncbi:MAG: fumarylacetoacetate hydrolase family protein [Euryarchaeota archaeon]|nr:fumarylacetoacetate hydrolase family protein [Euryarchaeota archaeon]
MVDIPVKGGGAIRPGKLICLLRNYVEHAEEMKSLPPDEPLFFLKPSTSIVLDGSVITIPRGVGHIHHEVELAAVIGDECKNVRGEDALSHVMGYATMIDVTARDVQAKAKKEGLPWSIAKGYDTFAPISAIAPTSDVPDPHNLKIWLKVNGAVRQNSYTSLMIHRLDEVISYSSSIMTLERGDIIATGTPKGVGPLFHSDTVEACVEGVGAVTVKVADAA